MAQEFATPKGASQTIYPSIGGKPEVTRFKGHTLGIAKFAGVCV
jgi:hypothetical protein